MSHATSRNNGGAQSALQLSFPEDLFRNGVLLRRYIRYLSGVILGTCLAWTHVKSAPRDATQWMARPTERARSIGFVRTALIFARVLGRAWSWEPWVAALQELYSF